MVYLSSDSGGMADHPEILFIAVVVGVLIWLCSAWVRSANSDDTSELPPVQIVAVPDPQSVYPNHHPIDVENGYVAVSPTPQYQYYYYPTPMPTQPGMPADGTSATTGNDTYAPGYQAPYYPNPMTTKTT